MLYGGGITAYGIFYIMENGQAIVGFNSTGIEFSSLTYQTILIGFYIIFLIQFIVSDNIYENMKIETIKSRWNNYFFEEKPVEGIAIFRILIGFLALFTFFQDSLVMHDFWGPFAIQSSKTSMMNYSFPILNIFQHLKITNGLLYFFVTLQFLALFSFSIVSDSFLF